MKVGILGATGLVGQRFIQLLGNHPYFEITELIASRDSVGKTYENAARYSPINIPDRIKDKKVKDIEDNLDCRLIFSALPSKAATDIEISLKKRGFIVLTNASSHRMDGDVPLVIPEINSEHIDLIKDHEEEDHSGYIVSNPNCSTIQLALTLKPIHDYIGVKKINIVTLQALSGAGYRGVNALETADNVIPYITGEEEKIEEELGKIFGRLDEDRICNEDLTVSASCNRVNVSDGHLENVSIETVDRCSISKLKESLKDYRGVPQKLKLPTAPERPIILCEENDRPQPRLDLDGSDPMSVYVGRVREDNILDYKFVILGHNTIRGAAGASILNAELLYSKGYI